jgi:hypothetical protein
METAEMELMSESEWPRTIEAAVAKILSVMTMEQRELLGGTEYDDLILFHHSLGMWVRNQFGLWRGNKELMDACRLPDPDDCSMVIIEACWHRLHGEPKLLE